MAAQKRRREGAKTVGQLGSNAVLKVALGCNLAIAIAKLIAAAWTGSSAMLAETVHSLVAVCWLALLLDGREQPEAAIGPSPSDRQDKGVNFWIFVVPVLLFAFGAGVSINEGLHGLTGRGAIVEPVLNLFILLGAAAVISLPAWKAFEGTASPREIISPPACAEDPVMDSLRVQSLAALAGLFVAFSGLGLAYGLDVPSADGLAAIGVGLVQIAVAALAAIGLKRVLSPDILEPAKRPVSLETTMPVMLPEPLQPPAPKKNHPPPRAKGGKKRRR